MAAQKHLLKDLFDQQQSDNHRQFSSMRFSQMQSSQRQGRQLKRLFFKSLLYDDRQSLYSSESNKNASKFENNPKWTKDQDISIITCLKENGADWVQISNQLENRTPLQIKNHFSKLLKEIMNMMINPLRQNKKRQIDFKSIKALLRAYEDNLGEVETKIGQAILKDQLCLLLYNYLINNQELHKNNDGKSLDIIHQILLVMKRNRKKKHGTRVSTEIYMKQEIQFEHLEEGYLSDLSSFLQQGSNQLEEHLHKIGRLVEFADESNIEQLIERPGVIIEETQKGICDLLKESGVLQYQQINSKQDVSKEQQSSSSSLSQNLNNDDYQRFYEQGELQENCYWKISYIRMDSNE